MDAHLKDFTGFRIKKRTAADPYDAELFCNFDYQGQDVFCKASVRRHTGALPDGKHIEIGRVRGYPSARSMTMTSSQHGLGSTMSKKSSERAIEAERCANVGRFNGKTASSGEWCERWLMSRVVLVWLEEKCRS